MLGQPRHAPLADEDASLVELQIGDVTTRYLLCAHVEDDLWICTRGLFRGGQLDEIDPFGEASLEIKDIRNESRCSLNGPAKKRIKAHLHGRSLYELAKQRPEDWNSAVAVAIWRAECERAAHEGRPLDEHLAAAGFERNPLAWRNLRGVRADAALSI